MVLARFEVLEILENRLCFEIWSGCDLHFDRGPVRLEWVHSCAIPALLAKLRRELFELQVFVGCLAIHASSKAGGFDSPGLTVLFH
ncbi:MAG: hypothetical protein ACI841_002482 [Planctomycetota bacterium]